MSLNTSTYYQRLSTLQSESTEDLDFELAKLRAELEYLAAEFVRPFPLQFPNLFSRIQFLAGQYHFPVKLTHALHSLRKSKEEPMDASLSFSALANMILSCTNEPIPDSIELAELPDYVLEQRSTRFVKNIRGLVASVENELVTVTTEDEETLTIDAADHETFNRTWTCWQPGDPVSLVDVQIDENDRAVSRFIVLHPDFLVDVSSLAECFQRMSFKTVVSPPLYFINRFRERSSTLPLFLGNVVNQFLDQIIRENGKGFKEHFVESFSSFPLEYVTLFPSDKELLAFMKEKLALHYSNLQRVINSDFPSLTPPLDRAEVLLEPSFLAPELGLQGRLDLLRLDEKDVTIVELKSGKVPWPPDNHEIVGENHSAQARLYQMMLQSVYGSRVAQVYVLYSSATLAGTNMRYVPRFAQLEKDMLDVRNALVHQERALANAANADEIMDLIRSWQLSACDIPESAKLPSFFVETFEHFQTQVSDIRGDIEREYFAGYLSFIATERWIARIGNGRNRRSHSQLWIREEHTEVADQLAPLIIEENQMDSEIPSLSFRLDSEAIEFADFRQGDIVVLYPYHDARSKASDHQVIKGYILEELNEEGRLTVGFRFAQHALQYFEDHMQWALQHDYMDHSFQVMQRELFAFCSQPSRLKSCVLHQEEPKTREHSEEIKLLADHSILPESQEQIKSAVRKALEADDYFLLVGPPGTGKTSLFLRNLVNNALKQEETILLLSYTNRAVDEISENVFDLCPPSEFMRIGSSVNCNPKFHRHLLHRIASDAANRKSLSAAIRKKRIVLSTVASIINRPEVFQLLKFDRIIVDEASQVLEPMLINLLRKAPRFVLIGDQKQLPAVVIQGNEKDAMITPGQQSMGIRSFKESLFERLLRQAQEKNWTHAWSMLQYQGRMHPDLMGYANDHGYSDQLKSAERRHQLESALFDNAEILGHRLLFFDSGQGARTNEKVNRNEANCIAGVVASLLEKEVDASTIGIIAPYRAQVALIKRRIEKVAGEVAQKISVDTVERFQGGQRDHIIYSTTITHWQQLLFLTQQQVETPEGKVDRKLNVAFTRARKQFILVGSEATLMEDPVYRGLVDYIRKKGKVYPSEAITPNELQISAPI